MMPRPKAQGKLRKARAEMQKRGVRIGEIERAHRRLEHLYKISKLLTRFDSEERTIPDVLAVVGETLQLHNALCVLQEATGLRTLAWQAEGETPASLEAAEAHAHATFHDLARLRARGGGTQPGQERSTPRSTPIAVMNNVIHLPLVVAHGAIFGAIQ